MVNMRDRETGKTTLTQKIENDVQIARWLADHNLIDPPLPFEPAPHVGAPGRWVIAQADERGVWHYEVLTEKQFEKRVEPFPGQH